MKKIVIFHVLFILAMASPFIAYYVVAEFSSIINAIVAFFAMTVVLVVVGNLIIPEDFG